MVFREEQRGNHLPGGAREAREQAPRSEGGVGGGAPPRRSGDVLDQPGRGRTRRDREAVPRRDPDRADRALRPRPRDRAARQDRPCHEARGTKIRDGAVRQHFIPEGWLGVGRSTVLLDGTELAAYDLERMLLELMRSRNKLPYDLYREAVASFRRRSERLDIYRLQDYAEAIPRGEAHLERAMEEVF